MKAGLKFLCLLACISLGIIQNGKADTLYSNNITTATDVSDWTLSGVTWNSSNSGQLIFATTGSYATMPVLPAGATNLQITVSAKYANYIYLHTSPDGSTYTNQGLFTGSSSITTVSKAIPDGTRSVKFVASTGTINDVYLISVTITGDTCTTNSLPVTGISLNKSSTIVPMSGTEQLIATLSPNCVGNNNIMWSSSNATIALVSNTGLVTAKSKGTAIITATTVDGGFTAQCTVIVELNCKS